MRNVGVESSLQPSQSDVDISYEETLSRVVHHHRRHKECLSQAAEAHRKGLWGTAVHYSHQARQHKKRHDDAKLLAAELFMQQRCVMELWCSYSAVLRAVYIIIVIIVTLFLRVVASLCDLWKPLVYITQMDSSASFLVNVSHEGLARPAPWLLLSSKCSLISHRTLLAGNVFSTC